MTRRRPGVARVTAVALSTAYVRLGELARRAFTGEESFVLEKGRLPVAAVVSAREWLAYLTARDGGPPVVVRRSGLSQPRARPTARRKAARPKVRRKARHAAPSAARRGRRRRKGR